MNSYELSRRFFDWCFENPEKIKPLHSAIYFFALEHWNRLGHKSKFGFPSQMTMDAVGIRKYQTYGKAFNDLIDWGFFELIEKSKNQYSANIISISATPKNGIARGKALDKATIKHGSKQRQSTRQSMDSIDKPINQQTNKPINQEPFLLKKETKKTSKKIKLVDFSIPIETRINLFREALVEFEPEFGKPLIENFFLYWSEKTLSGKELRFEIQKTWELKLRLARWRNNNFGNNTAQKENPLGTHRIGQDFTKGL